MVDRLRRFVAEARKAGFISPSEGEAGEVRHFVIPFPYGFLITTRDAEWMNEFTAVLDEDSPGSGSELLGRVAKKSEFGRCGVTWRDPCEIPRAHHDGYVTLEEWLLLTCDVHDGEDLVEERDEISFYVSPDSPQAIAA